MVGNTVSKTDFLTSPYFPDQYPYNAKCEVNFSPIDGASVLRIAFDTFKLYDQHSVTIERDDTVYIKNGNTTVSEVNTTTLLTVSGLDVPDDVVLTLKNNSRAKMTFSSLFIGDTRDLSVGQGFTATYDYLCESLSHFLRLYYL